MATAVEGVNRTGEADAGRPPVKVGSKVNITAPTYADGVMAEYGLDARGSQRVTLMGHGLFAAPAVALMSGSGASVPTTLAVWSIPAQLNGATMDFQRTPAKFVPFASTAITAGVGATIWTPGAGKKFRLMGWLISSSAAGQIIFGDNVVGAIIARSEAVAAAGVSKAGAADLGNGILSAVANNVLKIDGPTGNIAGMVWGVEE